MQWGSFDEAFLSIVAHHGRPVDINNIFPDAYRDRWIAGEDCDPVADLAALGTAVRRWFPDAFADAGVSLPSKPRFWHAVAGCAMLADWLGSTLTSFPSRTVTILTACSSLATRAYGPCVIWA